MDRPWGRNPWSNTACRTPRPGLLKRVWHRKIKEKKISIGVLCKVDCRKKAVEVYARDANRATAVGLHAAA